MFDPRSYCKACDRLTLDAEKIEEMITMTENTGKKSVRRPARVVLVAAALVAALGITASAAENPAVKEFFATVFVTISTKDDGALGLSLPDVAVEKREGRTILLVDQEETDITDALAQKGEFLYKGDGFEVTVDRNGEALVTAYGKDGMTVSYSTEGDAQGDVVYKVASDGDQVSYDDYAVSVDVEAPAEAEMEGMTTYNIVADDDGAIRISPAEGK